jgi:DNA-binding transcriptional regulator YiaG
MGRKRKGIFMARTYIKYYLSDYDVTREGQVINRHTGRVLKLQPNGKGYLRFAAQTEKGKKLFFVHREVAKRYVPNPENKPQVNHIDGNKTNNNADNLEWVTNYENRQHAIKNGLHTSGDNCSWSKLSSLDVAFIRQHPEMERKKLADLFGVTPSTISNIRYKRSWKDN